MDSIRISALLDYIFVFYGNLNSYFLIESMAFVTLKQVKI